MTIGQVEWWTLSMMSISAESEITGKAKKNGYEAHTHTHTNQTQNTFNVHMHIWAAKSNNNEREATQMPTTVTRV